ncbi:MAG TPA: Fe-S cluster assembly protein SufD [Methylomirabilota bacterium]|nr:Fe-S cluster assembly protein SufD [Methylomirabilota bacterium]
MKERLLAAVARLERDTAGAPAWLVDGRRRARDRFAEAGLPTTRDEEWKYTSLAPLLATDLDPAAEVEIDGVSEEAIAPFLMGDPSWRRLVFVNGRYSPKLSSVAFLPGGVRIGSLAEAVLTDAGALREHVAGDGDGDGFTALNAALWRDGAFVLVPAGAVVPAPLHLVFVATAPAAPTVGHPKNLIVLGEGSELTVVESYVAVGDDRYLTNAVTDIVAGAGARVDHYRLQHESSRAFHVGRTRIAQQRDSAVTSCAITFGGRLARHDVHVVLGGEGAECALNGLFVIGGAQHSDIHTVVDHVVPRGTSRQLYKGVLDGRARGVFNGRIVVRPGAQKTDAHQTNKNLLLADGVEMDSKPQLEIFADDVKCSHGAADGQLAGDALFYLESRGFGEAAARALLTYGFASEVLGRIQEPTVRARLEAALTARLRDGRVNEEMA